MLFPRSPGDKIAILTQRGERTMTKESGAVLNRKGSDRITRRHPWIFKGHLSTLPLSKPGDLIPLFNNRSQTVAWGFWSPGALCMRVLSFAPQRPDLKALLTSRFEKSLALRKRWIAEGQAFRLIHSESDELPGLIVDIYGPVASIQLLSAGWYRHKEVVLDSLLDLLPLQAVVLKNDVRYIEQEGIPRENRLLWGELPSNGNVDIMLGNVTERVYPLAGQKTGLYLDVRSFPSLFKEVACGARVLDCFSFQGHFGLHALHWGAHSVVAVEQSEEALQVYKENLTLNKFSPDAVDFRHNNAFDELRKIEQEHSLFDVIIMDPPPFSPGKAQIESARRGYKELALRAYRLLRPSGVLLYLCCSHAFSRDMLAEVLQDAAHDLQQRVRLIREGQQPEDHPVSLEIPETHYLKGFLLEVEK